jgi:tetratricopeptide (TPR) repeat protein
MYSQLVRLAALVTLCLALASQPAQAMSPDDGCIQDAACNKHYDTALQNFQDGHYQAALEAFQAAYSVRQMPWLLINIGRTLHRLGRLKEAVTQYERYQKAALNSDPETQQRVREYLAQARVLLGQDPAAAAESPPESKPLPAESTALTSAPPAAAVPVYKKWWFWTAIGGGVAVVAAVGIGIGVGTSGSSPPSPVQMPSMLPDGVVVYRPSFP